MAKSAATATSAEEYLCCWRGPLEQRLRKAVGKALAEQPRDPCTAVALELLHGTSLEERAAALSATQAEQEDGPQDDLAGELRKLKDENQSLKDDNESLKDQLNKVDAQPAAEWGIAGWVNSLALTEVVAKSLKQPAGTDPLEYVLSLSLADLESKLEAEKLSGLVAPLWSAVEKLRGQGAATGAALNAKFAAEGDAFKGEMGFGGLEQFYGGLEALIGAPLMVEGSLFKAMQMEHCDEKDADLPFATSNGTEGATSRQEWEFVVAPLVEDGCYPERGGDFRTVHPEWCRKAEPLSLYEAKMAYEVNPRLVKAGQAPLTLEELVAGRMYTGPMYEKYNAVLRFFAALGADGAVRLEYASMEEVPILQKKCGWLHLGEWVATAAGKCEPAAVRWTWNNQYTTTIHAINSIIVKLSPLTKITPLYRGWTGSTLPEGFFTPDALGFRGGVEYGFSSTTTDRAQAVHYAEGKASTVVELAMSMIDRGADISWLSQYPHEAETLLPPLTGLQVRSTGVEGSTLVVQCSFSINMATPTLEQVSGKRRKLLSDMGAQMAAEVRRGLVEAEAAEASQLGGVRLGLERCADAGAEDKRLKAPLGDKAEAHNSDVRFEAAMGDALKMKRAAALAAAMQRGGGGGGGLAPPCEMADCMAIELSSHAHLATVRNGKDVALGLLRAALASGPLQHKPEAYNDDARFSSAVDEALKIKRELAANVWAADGPVCKGGHLVAYHAVQHTPLVPEALPLVLRAMEQTPPALATLSTGHADAIAEVGRQIAGLCADGQPSVELERKYAAEARAMWRRVEDALVAPLVANREPMSRELLAAAVGTGLRCGLKEEVLAAPIDRLWELTAKLIDEATTSDALNTLIQESVEAGLAPRLGPALLSLARLFAAEGRGIPILASLPMRHVIGEVLQIFSSSHPKLRKLILKSCDIDGSCADAVAAFLAKSPPLCYEAYLNGNSAIGDAAAALFTALADNHSNGLALSAVSMPGCGVTDEAAVTLERLMREKRIELVELNLKDNRLSDAMKARLAAANEGGSVVQSLQL